MNVIDLAKRHYKAANPDYTLSGFAGEEYKASLQYLRDVSRGHRRASNRLLAAMHAAHVRLLPSEPFPFPVPPADPANN